MSLNKGVSSEADSGSISGRSEASSRQAEGDEAEGGAGEKETSDIIFSTQLVALPKSSLSFSRPEKITLGWGDLYGCLILAAVFTARFIPLSKLLPNWSCLFRRITGGWPCPSCGMTRSFDWFAQGRFADSFLINPLGFFLASAGAILTLYTLAAPLRPPRPHLILSVRGRTAASSLLAAALLGNWIFLLIRHYLGLWP